MIPLPLAGILITSNLRFHLITRPVISYGSTFSLLGRESDFWLVHTTSIYFFIKTPSAIAMKW